MKKVLDTVGDVTTVFHRDRGSTILEHIQDVEPILEENKARAALHDPRQEWWFIGKIPNATLLKWTNECGKRFLSREWHEYARKQLNKSDYRKLNPNKIRLKVNNR